MVRVLSLIHISKDPAIGAGSSLNAIVRFLRCRPGDQFADYGEDAIGGRYFKDAMIDHITAGWKMCIRDRTYIDLDCSWGGVEIYVPSDWKVVFKCNAFFGGCDDKRWQDVYKRQTERSVRKQCLFYHSFIVYCRLF